MKRVHDDDGGASYKTQKIINPSFEDIGSRYLGDDDDEEEGDEEEGDEQESVIQWDLVCEQLSLYGKLYVDCDEDKIWVLGESAQGDMRYTVPAGADKKSLPNIGKRVANWDKHTAEAVGFLLCGGDAPKFVIWQAAKSESFTLEHFIAAHEVRMAADSAGEEWVVTHASATIEDPGYDDSELLDLACVVGNVGLGVLENCNPLPDPKHIGINGERATPVYRACTFRSDGNFWTMAFETADSLYCLEVCVG